MKKLMTAAAVVGLVGLGHEALAVNNSNPVDVEVYAQINAGLQITVTTATSYDFGTVAGGSVAVSATTFDIQNTGSGLTETYQIKGNNSTSGNWTLAAAPGANAFSLDAQFNNPSAPGSWTASHRLTTAYQQANGTIFAGNQTGVSTVTGQVQSLWTRFSAPTSSTFSTRQRVQLDINAVTP